MHAIADVPAQNAIVKLNKSAAVIAVKKETATADLTANVTQLQIAAVKKTAIADAKTKKYSKKQTFSKDILNVIAKKNKWLHLIPLIKMQSNYEQSTYTLVSNSLTSVFLI